MNKSLASVRNTAQGREANVPEFVRGQFFTKPLSRNHLELLFRRETGCSVKQFQMERRLREAAELLRNTDLLVSEIAYQVGFNHPPNFTERFKRRFGVPPLRFRQLDGKSISSIPRRW